MAEAVYGIHVILNGLLRGRMNHGAVHVAVAPNISLDLIIGDAHGLNDQPIGQRANVLIVQGRLDRIEQSLIRGAVSRP